MKKKIVFKALMVIAFALSFLGCNSISDLNDASPVTESAAITGAAERASDNLSSEINLIIESYVQKGWFNGSALVSINGEVILKRGYGFLDMTNKIEAAPDSKYWLASMGKQFTSLCIMQLYEQGLVDIYAPVTDYLPEFEGWSNITISNLMSHTSGLPGSAPFELAETVPDIRILEAIMNTGLEFEPGTRFNYSNAGYYALGMIIEKVSGMKYSDYLDKHIFVPLEMNNSLSRTTSESIENCAIGYTRPGSSYFQTNEDVYKLFSVGSIYSTVEDLYKWDRALYTEKLLKKETLDDIFTSHAEGLTVSFEGKSGYQYGYGWALIEKDGYRNISHGGYSDGAHTLISRYPDNDIAIILLSNCGNARVVDLENIIAQTLLLNPLTIE